MTTIIDNFTTCQTTDSIVTYNQSGFSSKRILSPGLILINGKRLQTFVKENQTVLTYFFDSPRDFVLSSSIKLTATNVLQGSGTLTLRLTDDSGRTGTITQIPITGIDVTFTPVTLTGQVDLQNIISLIFTFSNNNKSIDFSIVFSLLINTQSLSCY